MKGHECILVSVGCYGQPIPSTAVRLLAAYAGIESLRRFEIAIVRRKGVGRALPKAYLQADLDILQPPTPDTTSKMLAEAEAIKVGPATAS